MSSAPRTAADPAGISRRQFTTARKGYDPHEVRAYLTELASLVEELQASEIAQRQRADEAEAQFEHVEQVDEGRMVELLGKETVRVLDAARVAAADIRRKAEESASRLISEANDEAHRLRAEAEATVAAQRIELRAEIETLRRQAESELSRAQAEGEELVAEMRREATAECDDLRRRAQDEGRQMVTEAQVVRERMLRDLARRRRGAREQLERLNAARDRLLAAYEVVRRTVDAATGELAVALPEAKVAGEAAMRRVHGEPEPSVEELDDLVAMARIAGLLDPRLEQSILDDPDIGGDPADDDVPGPDGRPVSTTYSDEDEEAAVDAHLVSPADRDDARPPARHELGAGALTDDEIDDEIDDDEDGIDGVVMDEGEIEAVAAVVEELGAPPPAFFPPVDDPGAAQVARPEPIGRDAGSPEGADSLVHDVVDVVAVEATVVDAADAVDALRELVDDEPAELEDELVQGLYADPVDGNGRLFRLDDRAHVNGSSGPRPADHLGDADAGADDDLDVDVDAGFEEPDADVDVDVPYETPVDLPGPQSATPLVDELFAQLRAGREPDPSPAETVDADPGSGSHEEPDQRVPVAVARSAATGTTAAGLLDGGRDRAAGDDDEDVDDGGPQAGADVVVDHDELLLRQRDETLAQVELTLARRLKRVLADEQNDVLDQLRRIKVFEGAIADEVLLDAESHVAQYATAASDELGMAATAGAVQVAEVAGFDGDCDGLASELAELIVTPLRERVARSFAESGSDLEELTGRLRSLYREWKSQRIGDAVHHYAVAAYAQGAYAAVAEGTPLRWLVDRSSDPCPDADDNALAGPVPRGDAFPTGDCCPPAHPGCRCLVVPIPESIRVQRGRSGGTRIES